jgi:hypothetical protein
VIYTNWFTDADPAVWADSTIFVTQNIRRRNVTAPGITAAILDNGVVMAYTRTATGVYPVPHTFFHPTMNGTLILGTIPALGRLIFYMGNLTTGVRPPFTNWGGDLRYVIIPGGVLGGRSSGMGGTNYTADQLRAMSYEQISQLFDIPSDGFGWH